MKISDIWRKCLPGSVLFTALWFTLGYVVSGQREVKLAVPAPQGIVIFAGMELADGNRTGSYIIERSYDGRKWEIIKDLKSPAGWDDFYAACQIWEHDFGFQGLPSANVLRKGWQKCMDAGVIDSMGYWASATTVRLAAGLAFYDKDVIQDKEVRYRVRSLKNGKLLSESLSLPVYYPVAPRYDPITLSEKNISQHLLYLKWQSQGYNPAPYFGIRYYEDEQLYQARGTHASYKTGDITYYIFQDSVRGLRSGRQYFLNPLDMWGNMGEATGIVLVSGVSAGTAFFRNTAATADDSGYGIILSWKLPDARHLKAVRVYRSDSFDGREYDLVATLPPDDSIYTDRDVIPDRINYYYLETVSDRDDQPQKSAIVFSSANDRLQPVFPAIRQGDDVPGGISVMVTASEANLAGVRIYRSDGITADLYPITDILKLNGNEVVYVDTSSILTGERSFLYAAKAVNTSSVESFFSDTLIIHPLISTVPPSPNHLVAAGDDGAVNLIWEDVRVRHRAIRGYQVYRRELPDGRFALLLPEDSIVSVPLFTDTTALAGKSYEYAVQTVDDLGGFSQSMALTAVTVKDVLLPVPPNAWLSQADGKVTVQWGEIAGGTGLKLNLYRYRRGESPVLLKSFGTGETQFTDSTVKKGDLWFYYTTFTDRHGRESARSFEAGIRVE